MESLLSVGLSNAVAAIVLALLAFAVDRSIRRPAISHCFWLLVLLKLVTPPLVRVPLPWPTEPAPAAVIVPEIALAADRPVAPLASEPVLSTGAADTNAAPDVPESLVGASATPVPGLSPAALAIGAWLTGSLIWWTMAAIRIGRFRRLLRHTRAAPDDVRERVRHLAGLLRLRQCPAVAFVPGTMAPLLWAPGRTARLLLPQALWQRLDDDQRDSLLAHELAHLRRRDHWVRRLELLAFGLYWWHPVAWWARRELEDAEERCCDGWVARMLPDSASAYAATLVETVAFLSTARVALPLGASGSGQARQLTRRVTMILEGKTARPLGRLTFAVVLVIGATLLALAPGGAEPPAPVPAAAVESNDAQPSREQQSQQYTRASADRELEDKIRTLKSEEDNAHNEAIEAERAAKVALSLEDKTSLRAKAAQQRFLEKVKANQISQLMVAANGQVEQQQPAAQQRLEESTKVERTKQAEAVRDEIERLEVQIRIKKAQAEAAMVTVQAKREVLQRFEALQKRNVAAEEDVAKARSEERQAIAEVQIRQAELGEPEVLLKQARRRLAALEAPAAEKKGAEPPPKYRRGVERQQLEDMEKKVEELRKEIESLRKQSGPQGAATPSPGGKGALITEIVSPGPFRKEPVLALVNRGTIVYTPHPSMKFSYRIQPELRDRARTVSLWVSSDGGKTWKESSSARVGEGSDLSFNAPRDGRYQVATSVTDAAGKQFPPVSELTAHQTVVVDRQRPEIEFKASNADDELSIDWKIQEDYPDLSSFLLEYRLGGEWKHLDMSPSLTGHKVLKPGTTAVRLRIRDMAGNETTGVVDPLP
jgi:bla regulator protein blaR1